ncbi:alpha/beta hydrolase fold-domain-containing protein [Hypoxylon crocopeplum]|nr:alpha/beta hydrolase fold-domain-containing protein [Hypoxylon crocopeplum]
MKTNDRSRSLILSLLCISSLASAFPHLVYNFPNHTSSIAWGKCEEDGSGAIPDSIECGVLMVPLDHFDPTCSTSIKIGMSRLRANDTSKRQGAFFFNNGGPGQPSSPSLVTQAQKESRGAPDILFGKELRDAFDIIGVDMRGEGRSESLTCDANLLNAMEGPIITSDEIYEQAVAQSKALGESCARMSGPLFYHMGTNQALRDLDMVRQALGEEKLNYLGWSYGTQLGSEYAETFPHRVGRMVLDGVFDRAKSDETLLLTGASGYESTLNRFFEWCNETSSCALHGRDAPAIFDQLVASTPLSVPECEGKACKTSISRDDFIYSVLVGPAGLHDGDPKPPAPPTGGWFNLAEALSAAYAGNATAFTGGFETSNTTSTTTTGASFINIFCADRPRKSLSAADFRSVFIVAKALAPRTLGASVGQKGRTFCLGWPTTPEDPPHILNQEATKMLPPIMMVSNLWDEATVTEWALDMRAQMPTAFNVFRNGGGHTSYRFHGETSDAIVSFLVNGTIPKDGTIYET